MLKRCVIVGGADIGNYDFLRETLLPDDYIIFCDSGLKHLAALQVKPGLIVGDFDSHENPHLDTETIVLPCEKDDTDTVYAMKEAIKRGFDTFLLIGVVGGRLDHTLGNISMLLYHYQQQMLVSCTNTVDQAQENGKNIMEFLGFAFDGCHIRLRDKTISKYYNRTYRKARTIARNDGLTSKGTHTSGTKLYKRYSVKGSVYYRKEKGISIKESYGERNFLDYVHGATKVMQGDLIDCITPRHMGKIKRKAFKKR